MIAFHKKYFLVALFLFFVEVFIALFVQDKIIRPYAGDFLVVMFLYFLLKSFFSISVKKAVVSVLLFAYLIELMQYFNLLDRLELGGSRIAGIIFGSYFEWLDMFIYTAGAIAIFIIESIRKVPESKKVEENPE